MVVKKGKIRERIEGGKVDYEREALRNKSREEKGREYEAGGEVL